MFNLQGSEIIVILLLALVVLGPEKLPEAVRRFTQTYNEIKKMGAGFQSELKSALDEPMREMRETADMVREAADPDRIVSSVDADRKQAKSAPGDPPLVDPEATEPPAADAGSDDAPAGEAPATDGQAPEAAPPNVNMIAAGNASGAIEAATQAAAEAACSAQDADRGDDLTDQPETDRDVVADSDQAAADGADRVVSGPAFHSAAPPRTADAAQPGRDGDDTAVEGAVESSDETATA